MPAGHPLQRLARCTGHKESDDAFWAIMDWQSEDEHKEKKAVQKSKKPKENPPGRAPTTSKRARRHPSVDWTRTKLELQSQSRAQAVAQRRAVETHGDWEPNETSGGPSVAPQRPGWVPGTTRPAEPAAPPSTERRANSQAGGLAQQMMRTAIKMDKRAQRTWTK